jgi:hypothetical protein
MTTDLETTNLVKHYFNICNTALSNHRESPVYGSLLALINQFASGSSVLVKVVEDDSTKSRFFTTRFIDGEFTPVMEGKTEADARFDVECSFLEAVMKNSDEYVDNPKKLDWSWLHRSQ